MKYSIVIFLITFPAAAWVFTASYDTLDMHVSYTMMSVNDTDCIIFHDLINSVGEPVRDTVQGPAKLVVGTHHVCIDTCYRRRNIDSDTLTILFFDRVKFYPSHVPIFFSAWLQFIPEIPVASKRKINGGKSPPVNVILYDLRGRRHDSSVSKSVSGVDVGSLHGIVRCGGNRPLRGPGRSGGRTTFSVVHCQ